MVEMYRISLLAGTAVLFNAFQPPLCNSLFLRLFVRKKQNIHYSMVYASRTRQTRYWQWPTRK